MFHPELNLVSANHVNLDAQTDTATDAFSGPIPSAGNPSLQAETGELE